MLNVFGNGRPPCYHSDWCLSFILPVCVSCGFTKTSFCSLGGMKETTVWRWFYCVLSVNLCVVRTLFPLLNIFSICRFDSFHYVPEESVSSNFSFDFCLFHQITSSDVDVIDCEAPLIVVVYILTIVVYINIQQERSIMCW